MKEKLKLKKDIAATITPYFKLKACFHPFFLPALVTDFTQYKVGKELQQANEKLFIKLMDQVTYGISLSKCDDDEDEVVELAYSIVHGEGVVDPSLFLDCSDTQWERIENEPLDFPFYTLGKYLVTYVIRNALKSEVLSIHSRLVFLSGVIDFIEAYFQVNDSALEFIDSLAEEFQSTFEELEKIKNTMNQEELFFFADTYQRMSDFSNHAFSLEGYEIYFCDLNVFFVKYINLLKFLVSRYDVEKLEGDFALNFLDFITDAEGTLDYLIETGFPENVFESESEFLNSIREPCLNLLGKQKIQSGVLSSHTQTNIHRARQSKSQVSYLENVFKK